MRSLSLSLEDPCCQVGGLKLESTGHLNLHCVRSTAHRRVTASRKLYDFFNFYIILFPICQKYMPIFFLQKCHPAASSTGGMKVPPDEPAAGALQKAYRRLQCTCRRFIRRKGYCSDPRGHCSDLPPIQTAVPSK